jgi:hypothetical protein
MNGFGLRTMLYVPLEQLVREVFLIVLDILLNPGSMGVLFRRIDGITMAKRDKTCEIVILLRERVCGLFMPATA